MHKAVMSKTWGEFRLAEKDHCLARKKPPHGKVHSFLKNMSDLRSDGVLLMLVGSILFPAGVSAEPRLRCQVIQGGNVRALEFAPVKDPYNVEAIDIGRSFRFKAVVIGDVRRIDYIKIYTYYQSSRQSVLLHVAKYLMPSSEVAPSPDALTGVNYLYSPVLGRELQYGCALFEVAP